MRPDDPRRSAAARSATGSRASCWPRWPRPTAARPTRPSRCWRRPSRWAPTASSSSSSAPSCWSCSAIRAARTSTRSSSPRRSGRKVLRAAQGLGPGAAGRGLRPRRRWSWPRPRARTPTRSTPPTWRTPSFIRAVGGVGQARALRDRRRARGRRARGPRPRRRRARWGCSTASRPSRRRSRRSASASSRPGRSATACRSASSTTPTAAAPSPWWRPALAVAYGADLVEKHFTLDRSEKGYDYQSSLEPRGLLPDGGAAAAGRARGRATAPRPTARRRARYHRMMARSIVAGALIPRGEVLTAEMLAFKRTDVRFEPGFAPREAHRVIGRRAAPAHPGRRDDPRGHAGVSAVWASRVVASSRRAWPRRATRARRWRRWPAGRCWRCCSSAWRRRAALDGVVLATSANPENDPLVDLAARLGVPAFRGDEDDVLRRHLDCARALARRPRGARHRRQPADRPRDRWSAWSRATWRRGADYTYVPGDALLMGILPEVISRAALERSWERGEPRHRSELVTLYIKEHPRGVPRSRPRSCPQGLYRPEYRLTVDEAGGRAR